MTRGLKTFIILSLFVTFGLSFLSAGVFNDFWSKLNGKVIMYGCNDSCDSLDYACGTQLVCGANVTCGACQTGYTCSRGQCIPPLNISCTSNTQCNDNNFCTNDTCTVLGDCLNTLITWCKNSDGCCPNSCNLTNDNDCYSVNQSFTNKSSVITTNTCVDRDNGINYYQKESSSFYWDYTVLLKEGETINVSGRLISIAFLNSTFVRLNIDGLIITELIPKYRSYIYPQTWDAITINQINYSQDYSGVNRIEFSLYNLLNSMTNSTDFCIDSGILDEFYCEGNSSLKNITYNCAGEGKVCSNGACLAPPKCSDSDGGLNYYTKGTVTYTYGYTSTIPNDKSYATDYCSGRYINEAYCFNNSNGVAQFGWGRADCNYGCLNGACKKLLGIFR